MNDNLSISICTPARLHFGFIDLHGGLGRHYGGVGVALAAPQLQLSMRPAKSLQVHATEHKETLIRNACMFAERSGLHCQAEIEVQATIPIHQGLGSGTQTCLALAAGLARLQGVTMEHRTIAQIMERGRRSGIGLGVFSFGGLLVDGGKHPSSPAPPALIARYQVPEAWRVLLLSQPDKQGLSASLEKSAFAKRPHFSTNYASYLSRILVMKLMPAMAEKDFVSFAEAVSQLQNVVGDYFSYAQANRFANSCLLAALDFLHAEGVPGIGQSSWGPTGFVLAPDEQRALQLQDTINQRFTELQTRIVSFDNQGARFS